jgi:hypothetical protein
MPPSGDPKRISARPESVRSASTTATQVGRRAPGGNPVSGRRSECGVSRPSTRYTEGKPSGATQTTASESRERAAATTMSLESAGSKEKEASLRVPRTSKLMEGGGKKN